jgi:mannosyltransferase
MFKSGQLQQSYQYIVHRPAIGLMLITVLSAMIRFYRLDHVGLWLDELYSVIGSHPESTLMEIYNYSKSDQPPALFLFLHFWLKTFGYTDFSARALACMAGIAGVPAIYFLGKEIKGPEVGLWAALITSVNWFHSGVSKEIRFYAFVFLLSTLSVLYFIRCIKRAKSSDFLLYFLFTSLLLNTHYFGMAVFVSQIAAFLIIILFFGLPRGLITLGLLAGITTGFSFTHWVPVIISEMNVTTFHAAPLRYSMLWEYLWSYFREPVSFSIYLVAIVLVVRQFYYLTTRSGLQVTHVIVTAWIVLGVLLPLIYSIVKVPILTPKYEAIVVPALFVVIAYGITLFRNDSVKAIMAFIIVLSSFILLFIARPLHKPRRSEDWREIATFFSRGELKTNPVIFSNLAWFHQYYFQKNNVRLPMEPNTVNVSNVIAARDSVWLLENDRYSDNWAGKAEALTRAGFEHRFMPADTILIDQSRIILFVRRSIHSDVHD